MNSAKSQWIVLNFVAGGNPDPGLPGQGASTSCGHHEWRGAEGAAQEHEAGAGGPKQRLCGRAPGAMRPCRHPLTTTGSAILLSLCLSVQFCNKALFFPLRSTTSCLCDLSWQLPPHPMSYKNEDTSDLTPHANYFPRSELLTLLRTCRSRETNKHKRLPLKYSPLVCCFLPIHTHWIDAANSGESKTLERSAADICHVM